MGKLISWVEIPTNNFDRAVDFYNLILKLDLKKHDFGSEKMAFFPNKEGAISYASNFKPGKDGVLVSFHVDDIDKVLKIITENGGETVQKKTKIEADEMGYFALFYDCEGNKIGLYQNN